jgi:acyl-coenzyme A synthetase/AMP-(fatty) acid ligase
MHILDMIYYWARTLPHRAAIIQNDSATTSVVSYQRLADTIESIGERIDGLNLDKREPVAVCIAKPSLMLATVFALLRSGYSAAPVNSRLYPRLAGAGLRNLIYDAEGQVTSGGRNIRFDGSWLPSPRQPATTRAYRKRPTENASLIFFTSGTTGLPKKVVQPAAALDQRLKYFSYASEAHQKVLVMPALASAFGVLRVCEVLNLGKTAYFAPESMAALSLINLFGVEVVIASATQALALAERKNKNPGYRTDSLKAIFVGGGKIESEGIARIRTALCRNVINAYGSTETGTVALTPFDVLADAPGAIALPWAELEVVDAAGLQLPAGAEGFVRIRTPELMENIKAAGPSEIPGVRDDWFYPGDIGSLDANGVLRLVGRGSDVINRGGVKVSGTRIEEILKAMPEISDAAACGVAGASGLEEIWIAVVANGGVDIDGIKRHLGKHHDIRSTPNEVFVVDRIPRGDLGKVQQHRLKELLLGLKRGA